MSSVDQMFPLAISFMYPLSCIYDAHGSKHVDCIYCVNRRIFASGLAFFSTAVDGLWWFMMVDERKRTKQQQTHVQWSWELSPTKTMLVPGHRWCVYICAKGHFIKSQRSLNTLQSLRLHVMIFINSCELNLVLVIISGAYRQILVMTRME